MKTLTLTFSFYCALATLCWAGPERYSGKEVKQVAPAPCDEFYADREFNVSVWGAYAFSGTENDRASIEDVDDLQIFGTYDRFLAEDHAWGGGIDAKYFFCRYIGVGIEGVALAGKSHRARFDDGPEASVPEERYEEDNHTVGGVLGTLTFRYPFHCSRFAPYAFAGGGGIWGGSNDRLGTTFRDGVPFTVSQGGNDDGKFMGQFGGGLEVRLTHHIGLIGDFSWNVLDGPNNNFGLIRSGVNFAF